MGATSAPKVGGELRPMVLLRILDVGDVGGVDDGGDDDDDDNHHNLSILL